MKFMNKVICLNTQVFKDLKYKGNIRKVTHPKKCTSISKCLGMVHLIRRYN